MNNLNKKQKIALLIIAIAIILIVYYYINSKEQNNFEQTQQDELKIAEVENTNNENEQSKDTTIKVHVSGAVKQEGIVELIENSRVSDAIEEAGGLKEDAYLGSINLAYILEDGMKIYIPNNQEKEKIEKENSNILIETERNSITNANTNNISIEHSSATTNKQNKNSKININLATQSELESLPGIGPSTALKIVNYRKENGKFKKIDDIKQVSGIGDSKFNKIKDLIVVN